MISTLFASLNTDLDDDDQIEDLENVQPVLMVMQKTMPIFQKIAELWVEELDVLEVIYIFFKSLSKYSVKCFKFLLNFHVDCLLRFATCNCKFETWLSTYATGPLLFYCGYFSNTLLCTNIGNFKNG